MTEVKKIPEGFQNITPMLVVKDGLKAIEYYKKVFGAIDKGTMMMPDNKSVAHATLEIGNSKIMLSDEFPEMKSLSPESVGGTPVSLYLYVENVDKTFNLAISEGATSLDPVVDQFWGDRHGAIKDPFGHIWSIATHVKDLTREEMKKAAEEAFSKIK
ncbi:MAG: VOC family protein [Candidatus Nitrosocosmicus sp.]|jgi:PhnB protein|uniref:VOC family protein n=1 Tax=Candidatus Nitrosocosmicus agrestis TaxID=2563600 RepID=UPI00122E62AB|nr:VOC family protein [Candidatus Nitrosocosmicus sp. SS]KAA2278866.1 VOC family protein [Candidatus Nitrosocosmicus sp. SS]KAF0867543.1 VOC family protein [Candidatus Nitrosocosmicus sp. SS]MDR4490330.1 VOC family protein [Candidatus Nitrosocosmicus sp.]